MKLQEVKVLFRNGLSIEFETKEFRVSDNFFTWDSTGLNQYPAYIDKNDVIAVMVEEVEVEDDYFEDGSK